MVEDRQLSLAIGKKGQNVRLAAKLTGWKIDIKSDEEKRKEVELQLAGHRVRRRRRGGAAAGAAGHSRRSRRRAARRPATTPSRRCSRPAPRAARAAGLRRRRRSTPSSRRRGREQQRAGQRSRRAPAAEPTPAEPTEAGRRETTDERSRFADYETFERLTSKERIWPLSGFTRSPNCWVCRARKR